MIMKTKTLALVAFTIFNLQFSVSAQAQRPSREEREAQRAEMIAKQADKLAKDFNLKGDDKTAFVEQFKAYQRELQEVQRDGRNRMGNQQGNQDDKKMTEEEAKKAVDQYFERQERQIAQLQKRLEIERRYYEEFSKTFTPQQLARIFRQQQQMQQRQFPGQGGPRPNGMGGRPQGFGGDRGFGGSGSMGGDF